ncbi:MAG: hypothetical protein AAGB04_31125, partial [Pseudomonadota bacterium]
LPQQTRMAERSAHGPKPPAISCHWRSRSESLFRLAIGEFEKALISRWQRMTGKRAVSAASPRTIDRQEWAA